VSRLAVTILMVFVFACPACSVRKFAINKISDALAEGDAPALITLPIGWFK